MTSIVNLSVGMLALAYLTGCGFSDDSGLAPLPPMNERPEGPKTPHFTPPDNKPPSLPEKTPTATLKLKQNTPDYFPVRRCMNMGNALEAENEGDWGYRIEASHFAAISAAGFDTVRVPIRWAAHTAKYPPYKIKPSFMRRVKTVVRQAQNYGLGVIIDVHHYEALMEDVPGQTPRFMAIWQQIATEFKDAPANVYFEVLNEPITPMTMAQANALYAQVVPLIRRTNPKRALIMGGDNWNSIDSLDNVVWPKDPYLVATFHDYGPYEFTHQGASWVGNPPPLGRRWGQADDLKELMVTYDIAKRFKKRTGLPVLVGEIGVIDTAPPTDRAKWMATRRRTIEYAGMSWCAWDFGGAFKTYDVNTNRWFPGMREAMTGP